MIKKIHVLELTDCPEGETPSPCTFTIPGLDGAAMTVATNRGTIQFSEAEMGAIFTLLKDVYYG